MERERSGLPGSFLASIPDPLSCTADQSEPPSQRIYKGHPLQFQTPPHPVPRDCLFPQGHRRPQNHPTYMGVTCTQPSLPEHPGLCQALLPALLGLQALPEVRKAASVSPWTQIRNSQPCMLLTRGPPGSRCGLSSD